MKVRRISSSFMRQAMFVVLAVFALVCAPMPKGISAASTKAPTIVQVVNPSPSNQAEFGLAVAGIGDINGDSIGDLAVGAPGADIVYLFSGVDRSIIRTLTDPDELIGYSFGYSVRAIGDIDGNGIGDIAVGAPALSDTLPVPDPECLLGEDPLPPKCYAFMGRAFVFSGNTGELLLRPEPYRYRFGYSVAPLGDVNGDGIPDIAVGAPFLMSNLGGVYAFSGSDGTLIWETLEPEAAPGVEQPFGSFGMYMAEVEDLNGDGFRELLVGAPFSCNVTDSNDLISAGMGFVLSGSDGSVFRTHENPTPVFNDFFGGGLSALGDQDGDGIGDYAIGEARAGIVHVYSGTSGNSILEIKAPLVDKPDFFGFQIARVDDKDGDGFDDFWVAAPDDTFTNPPDGGTVYLLNSTAHTLITIGDPNPFDVGQRGFGWQISATGDLDGDGGLDLVIGKPLESLGEFSRAGAVYIALGVAANLPPVANAGTDQTFSVWPDCFATIQLDGSQSTDPDGDPLTYTWTWDGGTTTGVQPTIQLTPGTFAITLTVNDGTEDSEPDTVTIDVIDATPPEISLSVDRDTLWPPNYKMVDIGLSFELLDNCDSAPFLSVEITSDEPTATARGAGGAKHAPDATILNDATVLLRAERSGKGDGRVYMITITATDASGNSASSSILVNVNRDKRKEAIDSGQVYNALEIN